MIGRGRKAPPSPQESIEHLGRVVRERVEQGRSTGIAAGMVLAGRRTEVIAHGDAGEGRKVGEHTVFEIGSITKLFTATLLAEMAQRGELGIDEPVAGLLPPGTAVPARGGRQITLGDLATHTSGLPSQPGNHEPADPRNPLGGYTAEQLYAFLADFTPARDPGARYEYSNLGAGLLGHALALRAQTGYEELLRERILDPLGMTSTSIALPAAGAPELACGHDARGRPAPYIDLALLAGAGALRSTVPDMLRFAAAGLGDGGGVALQRAMATTQEPRKKVQIAVRIGLGWHIVGTGPRSLLTHSGGTVGFSTSIGLRPARATAVVVLANSRQTSVEDIALHVLEPRLPLRAAPQHGEEIELPAGVLERYAGVYDLAGTRVTITREPEGLVVRVPGDDPSRLCPESTTRFFFRDMEAQVVFKRNGSAAILHQDGQKVAARKIA